MASLTSALCSRRSDTRLALPSCPQAACRAVAPMCGASRTLAPALSSSEATSVCPRADAMISGVAGKPRQAERPLGLALESRRARTPSDEQLAMVVSRASVGEGEGRAARGEEGGMARRV